jgi:uncharacterized protein YjdB
MRKVLTLTLTLVALMLSTGSFAAIWGTLGVCVGNTTLLTPDSLSTSGTWSSSTPSVATVGLTTGIVTGISAGTSTISWNGTSGLSTAIVTVSAMPPAIGGGGSPICAGATTTLTNAVPGGVWSSYVLYVATVDAATGVVTGSHAGTATIAYTVGGGCMVSTVVTVIGATSDSLTGPTAVCAGSTITISSILSGGTWTSSSPSIATVSGSGVVTGVAAGTAIITHAVTGTCGTTVSTRIVTVTSTTSPGTITGTTSVGIGFTTSLYDAVSGGTWSSSTPSIATISSTGIVTGVAAGTTTITYTVTGCSGPAYATTVVTVTTPNCISGDVLFTGAPLYGPVKVWLIKYNPTTHILSACDSTYVYCTTGTSVHYSFCGMGTDSFRVKAADDSMISGTGYLPTYHTSSPYWGTATVIYHVAGTNDLGKDITMGYGTTTSGPGFIAGDVTTGANKGTVDGAPVPDMLVFCVNNTTGAILQQTRTNAAGHYTFSNLPVGEPFKIYPEDMNYATTPYPAITFTSSSTSMTVANFVQHTVSMTITPNTTAVASVTASNTGISIFPNPASGTLNVKWSAVNAGNGTVVIADVTGREVLHSNIDMSAANGSARISLDGISNGIYMVSIKANGVNQNAKIEIQ